MPKTPQKKALRKNSTRTWTWMLMLTDKDIDQLRRRFSSKGLLWDQWEYKLRAGKIIIYTPITPYNPTTNKPDPSLRYMAKHLRIVPTQPGPFQLEYWRHTEQWWPLPWIGDIDEIADQIEADEFGMCAPTGQWEVSNTKGMGQNK